ncbi:epoxide hydrolase family protein [Sinorhizobium sp. 8-89]|uniref:epoxide hydrolase family protein n=1 Tax=Sinorhizobium sp. 8-89 TaxID=3049089 RepID=UPI003866A2AA
MSKGNEVNKTATQYRNTVFGVTATRGALFAVAAIVSTVGLQPSQVMAASDEIRQFTVNIPDEQLAEMRQRIAETRWPEKETVQDSSQGVPLAAMRKLADYWAKDYDWRKGEAKLNAYPQFVTEIDGLDIHFIHVRSKHKNALPLVINHGWPGSVFEQLKIIDPLVNPTAYGGKASDAFDVVIPSMPGYGFSDKPASTGWGPERMARAWHELMQRLGYKRYVAQGGDWGAFVVDQMGLQKPKGLLAVHTNMPATVPADVDKALLAGAPAPSSLSSEENRAYQQLVRTFKQVDYARLMATRPQTLYGIADSPVGLAAWLLDHNDADGQPAAAVATALTRKASSKGELTRDEILDNISLYWLTNTGVSASRLYWEYKGGFFNTKGVMIPVAVSVFPGEQYEAPRSWTEKAYPNLIHYNKVEKGGHFAAWEQPMLFAKELRDGFKSVR